MEEKYLVWVRTCDRNLPENKVSNSREDLLVLSVVENRVVRVGALCLADDSNGQQVRPLDGNTRDVMCLMGLENALLILNIDRPDRNDIITWRVAEVAGPTKLYNIMMTARREGIAMAILRFLRRHECDYAATPCFREKEDDPTLARTIIVHANLKTREYFFSTAHYQPDKPNGFVASTTCMPHTVEPRESLPSGIVETKEDLVKIYYHYHDMKEIPNPNPLYQP